MARPPCSASNSDDPFLLASLLLLGHHHRNHKQPKLLKRSKRKPRPLKPPLRYLKPGALAQIRDAQRTARSSSSSSLKKKRPSREIAPVVDLPPSSDDRIAESQSQTVAMTPGPSLRVFGPLCPQRKKLLAPKAPLSPAIAVPDAPSTPVPEVVASASPIVSESMLESLPLELLVRIVCNLHHDQLKPAFHVCKRLRQAVMVARQLHFDFTTPNRLRPQTVHPHTPRADLNWPFSRAEAGPGTSKPLTPKAPRQVPRPHQARLSLADMRQLAGPLFHGSASRLRRVKPPSLPRAPIRAVASHRVLFYEEELCKAVAQNSI